MTGRPVVAADFDLDDHIDTLAAEFGRELDYRLDDVLDEWTNPLADGHHCGVCGARLDKADRPCPFAPHEEN